MSRGRCWIELRYGWGATSVVVVRSASLRTLRILKGALLAEAKKRARESEIIDELLGMIHRADSQKLEDVLAKLIPEVQERS